MAISSTTPLFSSPIPSNNEALTVKKSTLVVTSEKLDSLFGSINIAPIGGKTIGSLNLCSFLKTLQKNLTAQFGAPTRFDLVGGALAITLKGEGHIQDIDISIEFPDTLAARLPEMENEIRSTLKELKIPQVKNPFLKKSLINELDFSAALFSLGIEGTFWVDISISAVKKRPCLFRRDDLRAPIGAYLLEGSSPKIESTMTTPEIALQDREAKIIVIDRPEELNHMAWPVLLLLLAKGNTLETLNAAPILRRTFNNYVSRGSESAYKVFQRVFESHGTPSIRSKFWLTVFLSHFETVKITELQSYAKECRKGNSPETLFLRFLSSDCLTSELRKRGILPLSYILGIVSWPLPNKELFTDFLILIDSWSWVERSIKPLFQKTLKELALEKVLSPDFSNDIDRQECIEILFSKCSEEEFTPFLPSRLIFELSSKPALFLQNAKKYSRLLSLTTKKEFLTLLSKRGHQKELIPFLLNERELFPKEFISLCDKALQNKDLLQLIEDLATKSTTQEELLECQFLLQNLESNKGPLEAIEKWASFLLEKWASFKQKKVMAGTLPPLLYLANRSRSSLTDKTKALLSTHLIYGKVKDISDESKKTVETLWGLLFSTCKEEERPLFIKAIKNWELNFQSISGRLFSDTSIQNFSEAILSLLIKESTLPTQDRRALHKEQIIRWEREGQGILAVNLFHRHPNLWESIEDLYSALLSPSPLKMELLFLLPDPKNEELLPFLKWLESQNKEEQMVVLIRHSLEKGIFQESHHRFFVSLRGFQEERAQMVVDFPNLLTLETALSLQDVPLSKKIKKELFPLLIESSLGKEVFSLLKKIAIVISAPLIFKSFPKIVTKLSPYSPRQKEAELSFWINLIPLELWVDYPESERDALLDSLQGNSLLLFISTALFIGSSKKEEVLIACSLFYEISPKNAASLAIPLITKLGCYEDPPQEICEKLFNYIEKMISLYDDPFIPFITAFKKALFAGKSNLFATHHGKMVLIYPEGAKLKGLEEKEWLESLSKLLKAGLFEELFMILKLLRNELLPLSKPSAALIMHIIDSWLESFTKRKANTLSILTISSVIKGLFSGTGNDELWLRKKLLAVQKALLASVTRKESDPFIFQITMDTYFYELQAHVSPKTSPATPNTNLYLFFESGALTIAPDKKNLCLYLFSIYVGDLLKISENTSETLQDKLINDASYFFNIIVDDPENNGFNLISNYEALSSVVCNNPNKYAPILIKLLASILIESKSIHHFKTKPEVFIEGLLMLLHSPIMNENLQNKLNILITGLFYLIPYSKQITVTKEEKKMTIELFEGILFAPFKAPYDIRSIEQHLMYVTQAIKIMNERNLVIISPIKFLALEALCLSTLHEHIVSRTALDPAQVHLEAIKIALDLTCNIDSYPLAVRALNIVEKLLSLNEETLIPAAVYAIKNVGDFLFLKRKIARIDLTTRFSNILLKSTMLKLKTSENKKWKFDLVGFYGDILLDLVEEEPNPSNQTLKHYLDQFLSILSFGFYSEERKEHFFRHLERFGLLSVKFLQHEDLAEVEDPYLLLLNYYAKEEPKAWKNDNHSVELFIEKRIVFLNNQFSTKSSTT